MKELIKYLDNIPDAYDDFILGVINYAKKNPAHIKLLVDFMADNKSAKASDVIAFISDQPDFHSYSAIKEIQQVS